MHNLIVKSGQRFISNEIGNIGKCRVREGGTDSPVHSSHPPDGAEMDRLRREEGKEGS